MFVCLSQCYIFPSGIDSDDLEREIEKVMVKYIGKKTPGATIAVSKGTELLFSKAYGQSNIKNNEEMEVGDSLEWGSITKIITFACVMQLVEDGKIDLDADIRDYLGSGFFKRLRYPKSKITMLHLMHHSAGWEETGYGICAKVSNNDFDLEKFVKQTEPKQVYEPGKRVSYSNHGVAIAGLIVEKITGERLYRYARTHIFDVLGMDKSTLDPARRDIPEPEKIVKGYTAKFASAKDCRFLLYPAGSAYGPVEDLAKLGRALTPIGGVSCPLFKSNETFTTFIAHSNGLPDWGNAHGMWQAVWDEGDKGLEHGGNTFGFSARLIMLADSDFSLAILDNSYGESHVMSQIPVALFGQPDLPTSTEGFLAVSGMNGYYEGLRKVTGGVYGFLFMANAIEVKAVNEYNLKLGDFEFVQIAPRVFYSYDIMGVGAFLVVNEDKSIYYGSVDWLKVSNAYINAQVFVSMFVGGFAFYFSIIFAVVMIIMLIVYICQRKKIPVMKRLIDCFALSFAINICMISHFSTLLNVIMSDFTLSDISSAQASLTFEVVLIWLLLGCELVAIGYMIFRKFYPKSPQKPKGVEITLDDQEADGDETKTETEDDIELPFPYGQWICAGITNVNMLMYTISTFAIDMYSYKGV